VAENREYRLFTTAALFFTTGTITIAIAGFTLFTSRAITSTITAFAILITTRFVLFFHLKIPLINY